MATQPQPSPFDFLRPEKLTGLAGFAAGPFGPLAFGVAGAAINALAGDGGQGKRLKEAQGGARELAEGNVDQGQLIRMMALFRRANQQRRNKSFQQTFARFGGGADSGLAQNFAANQSLDDEAQFASSQFINATNQAAIDKRTGVSILGSLV